MKFSIIIPVYNRPEEVDELLGSLTRQSYSQFEVLVIEDGSERECRGVVSKYKDRLDIIYYRKENTGQGFTRNYGFERASGDYFVIFDSDCLIPPHYLQAAEKAISTRGLDLYGGPDQAHDSFTDIQKAISYSMTSLYTTGGIRGRKMHLGPFHPRSFNMGISREVYDRIGGFRITRMGEDIEFSIRAIENGFKSGLVSDAYVFHKRRTSFSQFYKQLHFFGRARINIARFYPAELKVVHLFPAAFTLGLFFLLVSWLIHPWLLYAGCTAVGIYFFLIFLDAFKKEKSLRVASLSVIASLVQLVAYGIGFLNELSKGWKDIRRKKQELKGSL
ncbi:glycosyltransferase family 2 protein [Roseivirga sp. BDSF3-8]|uniref:glycosyltransferase n=1 Tax=Roseivirga sp. BDSF3-8 TaxID=3241598 RepID=UPI00353223AB